ncbi:MAG: HAD family phosphatase [Thermoflexales bacterium]|nr:HAD family phosphatase [Thermoflexales bacterium]
MLPAAVLFDMDGLMFDTETLAFRAWSRALAEHGLEMRTSDYSRLIGRNMADARLILLDAYGPDTPVDALDAARFRYSSAEVAERGVPLKPGLVALLDALDALGIPRAMATSTGRERATALLERAGLAGRFHAIVCGDDITRGKPAPDIFLVAARRLDAPSTSCLVLEDSEPGVRAAHAAHMKVVLVPDLAPVAPVARGLAWRIVANLEDVIPLLSQC